MREREREGGREIEGERARESEGVGTSQFEGVVATKWHLSRDYVSTNESLLTSLDKILQALDQNLREFD